MSSPIHFKGNENQISYAFHNKENQNVKKKKKIQVAPLIRQIVILFAEFKSYQKEKLIDKITKRKDMEMEPQRCKLVSNLSSSDHRKKERKDLSLCFAEQ